MKKGFIAFAMVLAAVLAASPVLALDPDVKAMREAMPKIVGGTQAASGAYPWTMALGTKGISGSQWCGGTLVAPRWVVTAAHCTAGETTGTMDVLVTNGDLQSGDNVRVAIDQIIDHPAYDSMTLDNDISLLHLVEPVDRTVCSVPEQDDPQNLNREGTMTVVAGWGATSQGGPSSNALLEVALPVYNFAQAQAAYAAIGNTLTDNMLPVGVSQGGKDSCQGDSGGPLITSKSGDWTLIGVVSWGEGCAQAGYPGVYAKVSNYRDWIEQSISDLENNTWLFNPRQYLAANPDVESAGFTVSTALTHYKDYGRAEARLTRFIPAEYLMANPDLEPAGVTLETALSHWNNYGKTEGRVPQFDPASYLRANPDLAAAGITTAIALSHYLNYGKGEKRAIFFNASQYLAANPDLALAGITADTAVNHYLAYGRTEGRMLAFDGAAYLAMNPDVAGAGFTTATAVDHYNAYGRSEGRGAVFVVAQ